MTKFSIKAFLTKRPLSWSAISSFEYNPEQWYQNYVIGNQEPASREMLFGTKVGTFLATDPQYLPQVPRYPVFELPMKCNFGKIPMVGYADGWDEARLHLGEYKTGKRLWDQKRADTHGQIDMYLLLLYIIHDIRPETVQAYLHWLPTEDDGDFTIQFTNPRNPVVHTFPTKRTMKQVIAFGQRVNATVKAMELYAKNHS